MTDQTYTIDGITYRAEGEPWEYSDRVRPDDPTPFLRPDDVVMRVAPEGDGAVSVQRWIEGHVGWAAYPYPLMALRQFGSYRTLVEVGDITPGVED